MNKVIKSMLITFAVGLAFIGIGSGIAFAEFSGLKYMGSKSIAPPLGNEITDTHEYQLANNYGIIYVGGINNFQDYQTGAKNIEIVPDSSLAADQIIFEVQHPKSTYVNTYQDEDYDDNRQESITKSSFEVNIYEKDFQFFNYWGQIVDDLKQKEIYDYTSTFQSSLVIKVAPSRIDQVRIH